MFSHFITLKVNLFFLRKNSSKYKYTVKKLIKKVNFCHICTLLSDRKKNRLKTIFLRFRNFWILKYYNCVYNCKNNIGTLLCIFYSRKFNDFSNGCFKFAVGIVWKTWSIFWIIFLCVFRINNTFYKLMLKKKINELTAVFVST